MRDLPRAIRRFAGSIVALVVIAPVLLGGCGADERMPASAWPDGAPAWAIQGEDRRLVIQLTAADGSALRTIAPEAPGGDQTNPDWSPDGALVTFVMTDAVGKDDLWVVNVDGTNARRVFDCDNACDVVDDPAWSPDGRTIAVCMLSTRAEDHVGTLAAIDVRTGVAKPIFTPDDPLDFCAGPSWSPDGTNVVLELVHRDGTTLESNISGVTLAVLDVTMAKPAPRPLTDPRLFAATADWSPDGKTIVYTALPNPSATNTDLFTITPDGGETKRLTMLADEGGAAAEPGFAADGRSVVFVSSATPGLVRVDADGGDVAPAFPAEVRGRHPRARPLPS